MTESSPISKNGRYLIVVVAFLGWAFSGVHMSINQIVMRVATVDMMAADFAAMGLGPDSPLDAAGPELMAASDENDDGELDENERKRAREAIVGQWFGWFTCAFLLGAAAGGYLFGVVGDRLGRAKAMAVSILCFSVFSGVSYFVETPPQLLVLRFLTCMGIGGMWPNGIALLSEAWAGASRPIISGIMGTAANIGILSLGLLTVAVEVTAEDWRWTFLLGAAPVFLGVLSWLFVPESPKWLSLQKAPASTDSEFDQPSIGEIFRPPILSTTIIGILLGSIPLFGGWGVANWANAWASEVGDAKQAAADDEAETEEEAEKPKTDPVLKSMTVVTRSLPGSITSLLGGAIAFWLGRKRVYFALCIGALICTQGLFRIENPVESAVLFDINMFGRVLPITEFLAWNAGLGFFSGAFFGWLPLCLPEMFPTRVRSTGAGVSFNWGRILTAIGILVSAVALKEMFKGRYADVGQITGFVYAIGLVVILLAPDTSGKELDD